MNSIAKHFAKGVFSSIGLIYIFILPVYLPIRVLGIELNAYQRMLDNPVELILYFSQITLLIAMNGIFLSYCYQWITKIFPPKNDLYLLHWYRVTALIFSLGFIVSSYFVLNPDSLSSLYIWSGVHYFIIGFFQLLIRAEIQDARRIGLSITQANNFFGVCLNASGIIALLIFSWFYGQGDSQAYSKYCLGLEIALFFYFLWYRQYYQSLYILRKQLLSRQLAIYLVTLLFMLVSAAWLSEWFMQSGLVGAVAVLFFIATYYYKLRSEVKQEDLNVSLNICVGYGLLLALLTGSIMTYLVSLHTQNIQIFNQTYMYEPLFSALIGLFSTWLLFRVQRDFSREEIKHAVFFLNFLVPILCLFFMQSMQWHAWMRWGLLAVFGLYALLEYLSLFYLRQVAQLQEYNQHQGAKLTNFNAVALNGLCPALLYIVIDLTSQFGQLNLELLLIYAVSAIILPAMIFNLSQRYLLK